MNRNERARLAARKVENYKIITINGGAGEVFETWVGKALLESKEQDRRKKV